MLILPSLKKRRAIENQSDILQLPVTINDLKDKYYDGLPLSEDEFNAIQAFDKCRLEYLNAASNGKEFDKRFLELQAKANLAPFTDFL